MVINCDYRSESTGFVNTRFTEYGWRGAKQKVIRSVTVYGCYQEDTFSVIHRRVIWSLREAGKASVATKKIPEPGKFSIAPKKRISRLRQENVARSC